MGLGLLGRGIGVTKFLAECGAEITVTDLKTKEQLGTSLRQLGKFKNIKYVLGEHRLEDFKDKDLIIRAANVPLDSVYLKEAQKNKIPVTQDATLFVELAPEGVKTIGITGTRGKSTVTHLLHSIVETSGKRVHLAGNVRGTATLPLLKKIKSGDLVVMELDSWQLQSFGEAKISPNFALFTTFLRDHQNYYKDDMERYFADKTNLYLNQKPEDYLLMRPEVAKLIKEKDGKKIKSQIKVVKVGDVSSSWRIKLLGKHNLENVALAVGAARILGIEEKIIKKAVENFSGVPGRLELVREFKGIKYYNDTTATTPDGVIAALEALGKYKGRIVLLGGGADKSLEYELYAKKVKPMVKALILFKGAATEKIKSALGLSRQGRDKVKFPVFEVGGMKEAFGLAKENAKKGDVVLLSPGAASFGIFKNEFDRGDQFNKLVNNIK